MVLSNAERQARYRERLKLLAAKGVMTPAQARMLADLRHHIRAWRRQIAAFGEGRMQLWTNHVDTTSDYVGTLINIIATNEKLLSQYDPDDVTADGNIEIGDLTPRESTGLLPGRWVSYALDDKGRAIDLRLFDDGNSAYAHAERKSRGVGVIGDDMWSIAEEKNS